MLICVVVAAAVLVVYQTFRSEPTAQNHATQEAVVQPAESIPNQEAADDSDVTLEALLSTLAVAKGDYAITVVEADGHRASANGSKQYTAASTYKLFIAYAVFQQVANSELAWTDTVMPDRSAEECFRLMIVRSDNDCPEAFGNLIGWQKVDNMMDELGLHNTRVKFHDNITTADDLALYLSKLSDGTLLGEADSQTLLGYMKQQIYRQGIPAGTDVTVADKPGFLYDLLHDAAIVYSPKETYVLVIMSDGSSWSQLADAAGQVNDFLNQ